MAEAFGGEEAGVVLPQEAAQSGHLAGRAREEHGAPRPQQRLHLAESRARPALHILRPAEGGYAFRHFGIVVADAAAVPAEAGAEDGSAPGCHFFGQEAEDAAAAALPALGVALVVRRIGMERRAGRSRPAQQGAHLLAEAAAGAAVRVGVRVEEAFRVFAQADGFVRAGRGAGSAAAAAGGVGEGNHIGKQRYENYSIPAQSCRAMLGFWGKEAALFGKSGSTFGRKCQRFSRFHAGLLRAFAYFCKEKHKRYD